MTAHCVHCDDITAMDR